MSNKKRDFDRTPKTDFMPESVSNDRFGSYDAPQGGGYQTDRKPLEWQLVHTVESGSVVLEISSAPTRARKLYSISVSRQNSPGKKVRHLRETDFGDLQQAIESADVWIKLDRGGK